MGLFNPRVKTPLHIVYIILVVAAMGLSVPRLFMKGQPRTRANTIALGMVHSHRFLHTSSAVELTQTQGAKSLIFIAYQISTEHVQAFRRWQSYKAYWILNALETVFWGAVVFLVMQANLARCVGVGCKLSWAVMALGIVLKYVCVLLPQYREHCSRYHPLTFLQHTGILPHGCLFPRLSQETQCYLRRRARHF